MIIYTHYVKHFKDKFMMTDFHYKPQKLFFISISIIFILSYGCTQNTSKEYNTSDQTIPDVDVNHSEEIAVSPPPFSDEYIFPCSDCHTDMEINTQPRALDMHEEIVDIFDHDSENRWCLACHDVNTRDSLRLASGKLLDFKESYKLCGQCHGNKLRDWRVGVHGKRTGEWNGSKQYLLCVHCHNPHSPKFEKLKPMPPPIRQEELRTRE